MSDSPTDRMPPVPPMTGRASQVFRLPTVEPLGTVLVRVCSLCSSLYLEHSDHWQHHAYLSLIGAGPEIDARLALSPDLGALLDEILRARLPEGRHGQGTTNGKTWPWST